MDSLRIHLSVRHEGRFAIAGWFLAVAFLFTAGADARPSQSAHSTAKSQHLTRELAKSLTPTSTVDLSALVFDSQKGAYNAGYCGGTVIANDPLANQPEGERRMCQVFLLTADHCIRHHEENKFVSDRKFTITHDGERLGFSPEKYHVVPGNGGGHKFGDRALVSLQAECWKLDFMVPCVLADTDAQGLVQIEGDIAIQKRNSPINTPDGFENPGGAAQLFGKQNASDPSEIEVFQTNGFSVNGGDSGNTLLDSKTGKCIGPIATSSIPDVPRLNQPWAMGRDQFGRSTKVPLKVGFDPTAAGWAKGILARAAGKGLAFLRGGARALARGAALAGVAGLRPGALQPRSESPGTAPNHSAPPSPRFAGLGGNAPAQDAGQTPGVGQALPLAGNTLDSVPQRNGTRYLVDGNWMSYIPLDPSERIVAINGQRVPQGATGYQMGDNGEVFWIRGNPGHGNSNPFRLASNGSGNAGRSPSFNNPSFTPPFNLGSGSTPSADGKIRTYNNGGGIGHTPRSPSSGGPSTQVLDPAGSAAPTDQLRFRSDYRAPSPVRASHTTSKNTDGSARNKIEMLVNNDQMRRRACTAHRPTGGAIAPVPKNAAAIKDTELLTAIGKCQSCHDGTKGRKMVLPKDPSQALWALKGAVNDKSSGVTLDIVYKMATSKGFEPMTREQRNKLLAFLTDSESSDEKTVLQNAIAKTTGNAPTQTRQILPPDRVNLYRGLSQSSTDNPILNAIISDPNTLYYDKKSVPQIYQAAGDRLALGSTADLATSARAQHWPTLFDKEGELHGKLGNALGLAGNARGKQSVQTFKFMRLPTDKNGKQVPIAYGNTPMSSVQKARPNSRLSSYVDFWDYPVGTTFGEALYGRGPDGRPYLMEIRTRTRQAGGSWHPDVYRRFPTAESLKTKIQEVFPNWKEDGELKALVSHIENKSRLKNERVSDDYFAEVLNGVGAKDVLPPLSADKTKKLIDSTPLSSSLNQVWDKNGDNVSFAPTALSSYHVTPPLDDVHAVAVSTESCKQCHSITGANVGLLRPNEINRQNGSQTPEAYFSTWTANGCPDGAPSFHPYNTRAFEGVGLRGEHADNRRKGFSSNENATPNFRDEFFQSGMLQSVGNIRNTPQAGWYR